MPVRHARDQKLLVPAEELAHRQRLRDPVRRRPADLGQIFEVLVPVLREPVILGTPQELHALDGEIRLHGRLEPGHDRHQVVQRLRARLRVLLVEVPPPVAQLRPGPHRQERLVHRVDHDEPVSFGADDGDPVRPVIDAQEHRGLLLEMLRQDLPRLFGLGAALEHEVALHRTSRACELDLVGARQPVRLRRGLQVRHVHGLPEREQRVLQGKRPTRVVVGLPMEPRGRLARRNHSRIVAPAGPPSPYANSRFY